MNRTVYLLIFLAAAAYGGSFWLFKRRKGGFPVWGEMVLAAAPFAVLGYLILARIIPVEMGRLTEQRRQASLGSLGIATELLVDREQFEAAWEKDVVFPEDLSGLLNTAMIGDGILYDSTSGLPVEIDQTADSRLYFYKNNELYSATREKKLNVPLQNQIPSESYDAMQSCAKSNQIVSAVFHDGSGSWMAAYTPVVGEDGNVIGIIELISDAEYTLVSGLEDTEKISKIIMYVAFGLMSAVFLIVWINMRPLKNLRTAVLEAADGNLEVTAKTVGHSEAAGIAAVFNRMLQGISGHISQMETFQKRYAALVPNELFLLLGNKDVRYVHLGDETEMEAFVMAVKGERRPDERLQDTNRCLEIQVSEIQGHGGIIEEFQGIGEESIFQGNTEHVLHCAVSILQRTAQDERLHRVRIGIAYGGVKIGMIGGKGRSSAVVISEYKRLAWFLWEMAWKYGASLLITDKAADKSSHFKDSYHYRILGYIYMTLHGTLERVYEVLDGDSEAVLSSKVRSREMFEEGVSCFMCGRFLEARRQFIQVLSNDKEDVAAQRYVHLCDQHYHGMKQEEVPVCLEVY